VSYGVLATKSTTSGLRKDFVVHFARTAALAALFGTAHAAPAAGITGRAPGQAVTLSVRDALAALPVTSLMPRAASARKARVHS
jgi:hypothetical protein